MIFKEAKVYKLKDATLSGSEFKELAGILEAGQVIVFPTETVYGLGCLYDKEAGKIEIFDIKKRKPQKRLPIMIKDLRTIESYFKCKPSSLAKDIMYKFMPGPLTVVLNCASGNSFAFRMPAHEFILDLISVCRRPLVATSANVSGEKPAVDFIQARRVFFNKVAAIIDGGRCRLREPSTIIDLSETDTFRIVREGVYSQELIKTALSNPRNILFVCTGNSCRSILAQAVLEKELKDNKNTDILVTSAGTAALENMPPSQDTIRVLREAGIKTDEYKTKRLTLEILKQADLVLTMERAHMCYILEHNPKLKHKTFGFLKFAFGLEDEIQDPIGKGIDEYRKVFSLISKAMKRVIKKIENRTDADFLRV